MNKNRYKRIGKIIVKSVLALMFVGVVSFPFLTGGLKDPLNPLSHKQVKPLDAYMTKTFSFESTTSDQAFNTESLLSNIKDYVEIPDGGTPWDVFGETEQTPYSYEDEDGMEWNGVRPGFSDSLKALEGKEILVQGYMFPLGQEEKQDLFLFGPFPVSCPYHYHVTPNLIIEAHAKTPIAFSYDAVNIRGRLELVPKDDEYNVFYRLNDAELIK